jgi:hypothetical protein
LVFGICAVSIGAFTLPSFSSPAGDISLTREVFLEKGYVPNPEVIVPTRDNGLIVAGSNHGQGWAARTDAEGNIKWRYVISRPVKPTRPSEIPTYISAAVMPDDSVFLCGNMPGIKGSGTGLLTHLDKDGKVLSEQLLRPEGLNVGGFRSCMAWNDGVVIVGAAASFKRVEPTPSHPLPSDTEQFHWIIALDAAGKVRLEKHVPTSKNIGFGDEMSPLQPVTDGGFVFVATRNGIGTEIVHVKPNGDIATKILDGQYEIILPTNMEKDVQLYSQSPGYVPLLTRITLNDDLQETGRVAGKKEPFTVRRAYRLPDETLVLFGSKRSTVGYKNFEDAGVMKLDPTLKHSEIMTLSPRHGAYSVETSAALSKPGEFICTQSIEDYNPQQGGPPPDNAWPGVALHFVTVK